MTAVKLRRDPPMGSFGERERETKRENRLGNKERVTKREKWRQWAWERERMRVQLARRESVRERTRERERPNEKQRENSRMSEHNWMALQQSAPDEALIPMHTHTHTSDLHVSDGLPSHIISAGRQLVRSQGGGFARKHKLHLFLCDTHTHTHVGHTNRHT